MHINGWTIHHDSDPRGGRVMFSHPDGVLVELPYDVIEEFVGQVMQTAHVSTVEQLTGAEFVRATIRAR